MRQETRRRLERALWLERAKWVGIAVCGLVAMAGVFTWISADATEEKIRVPATVTTVEPLATKAAQNGLLVHLTLNDGKIITVSVNQITDPKVGQKVDVTEHRHSTGRRTYSWK